MLHRNQFCGGSGNREKVKIKTGPELQRPKIAIMLPNHIHNTRQQISPIAPAFPPIPADEMEV